MLILEFAMSSVLINQEALRVQYPHEYVGEPMPSIAAPNQKGTVGFTLLPLKLLSYLQYSLQMV